MKVKMTRRLCYVLLILFVQTASLRAQSVQDILNSIKGATSGRSNSKSKQTTSKSDSAARTGSSNDLIDTSANSVLGAFAKAAAANPNDTSASDLTMKALGLMTGGEGVSRQDSVAAISSYKSASGGAGIHYEYRFTIEGKKLKTSTDTSKLFITTGGEGRSEMRIPMPGANMNKMINIGHFNTPKYTIMLYPDSKSYSLNIIGAGGIKSGQTYKATKIGTESVGGYSCIHSKVISSSGSSFYKTSTTSDVWTSTAVPGYLLYKKLSSLQQSQLGMITALDNAGCGGFLVKMVTTGNDVSMTMLLIKASEQNLPADLFRIPSGYSESKDNMISHMIK